MARIERLKSFADGLRLFKRHGQAEYSMHLTWQSAIRNENILERR